MKKGFTLVELSIVLVIIGLLIGGILVAQSLIESAKINEAVRQIQQYDIAVSNFQERYKSIPGDTTLMTPAGNGDGDIGDPVAGGAPVCGTANCSEYMSFWKHLSDVGMLQDAYTNDWSGGWVQNVNSPAFWTHTLDDYSPTDYGYQRPKGSHYDTEYVHSGKTVLALESKMDDGDTSTGYIRSEDYDNELACAIADETCKLFIIMLSTAGNPLDN